MPLVYGQQRSPYLFPPDLSRLCYEIGRAALRTRAGKSLRKSRAGAALQGLRFRYGHRHKASVASVRCFALQAELEQQVLQFK